MTDTNRDSAYPVFGKIPDRIGLITITEKMSGMTGLISIAKKIDDTSDGAYEVRAGSSKRWLEPNKQQDNYGFAEWVEANKKTLIIDLGSGNHYGVWWGGGIRGGYGLEPDDKRFSLYNTARWNDVTFATLKLGVVATLFDNVVNEDRNIDIALIHLACYGSYAVPGYMYPAGILIYEHASGRLSQVLADDLAATPDGYSITPPDSAADAQ